MPVSPEDIFSQAHDLCQCQGSEVERRTAASRSYYGFFHVANEYANRHAAEQYAVVPPSAQAGGTHANLSEFFSSSTEHPMQRRMKIRQIGIRLRNCHNDRCKADYNLGEQFSEIDLQVMHDSCKKGIAGINSL